MSKDCKMDKVPEGKDGRCVKPCKSTQKRNSAKKCVSNREKKVTEKKVTEKKARATRKNKKSMSETAPNMVPLFSSPIESIVSPKKSYTPTPYQFAFQDESSPFAKKEVKPLSPIKERGWMDWANGKPASPEDLKEKARYYKKKGFHGKELTNLMKKKATEKKAADKKAAEEEEEEYRFAY